MSDAVCENSLWIGQRLLLADTDALEQIIEAVYRVRTSAAEIARSQQGGPA